VGKNAFVIIPKKSSYFKYIPLLNNNYYKVTNKTKERQLNSPAAVYTSTNQGLDVYVLLDTTGSMDTHIDTVRDNIATVTNALLDGKTDRLMRFWIHEKPATDELRAVFVYSFTSVPMRLVTIISIATAVSCWFGSPVVLPVLPAGYTQNFSIPFHQK